MTKTHKLPAEDSLVNADQPEINLDPTRVCGFHGALVVKVGYGLAIGGGILVTLVGILITLLYQTVIVVPTIKTEFLTRMTSIDGQIQILAKVDESVIKDLTRLENTRNFDHPQRTPLY